MADVAHEVARASVGKREIVAEFLSRFPVPVHGLEEIDRGLPDFYSPVAQAHDVHVEIFGHALLRELLAGLEFTFPYCLDSHVFIRGFLVENIFPALFLEISLQASARGPVEVGVWLFSVADFRVFHFHDALEVIVAKRHVRGENQRLALAKVIGNALVELINAFGRFVRLAGESGKDEDQQDSG